MNKTGDFSAGPLSGIRVLDLSSVIMGPFATRIMADLGADVIRVEQPGGDMQRYYKPSRTPGMAGAILTLMRNKRSIALDLKKPAGKRALARIIKGVDVLVHNLRPKTITDLGFDYDSVRSLNPDIIYCAATGFGSTGPYAERPAYDDLIQAGSGIAALEGALTGVPKYVANVFCDKLCGQTIAWAVMAALVQRASGGGGQRVEVPMLETSVDFVLVEHLYNNTLWPDEPGVKWGYPRLLTEYRRPYRSKDGYVCLMPYSDRNWADFFDLIGRPELKADERYAKLSNRPRQYDFLYSLVAEAAPMKTNEEWVDYCDARGIPCLPVRELADLEKDPHLKAVELIQVADHPTEGKYRTVRPPVSFGGRFSAIRRHAPHCGQDSADVLAEAGCTQDEIEALLKDGVTALPARHAAG
jgi:crotonobetainyl-CoA:carnitine CoA-transferase CaiB-like acyl-CoA transferase